MRIAARKPNRGARRPVGNRYLPNQRFPADRHQIPGSMPARLPDRSGGIQIMETPRKQDTLMTSATLTAKKATPVISGHQIQMIAQSQLEIAEKEGNQGDFFSGNSSVERQKEESVSKIFNENKSGQEKAGEQICDLNLAAQETLLEGNAGGPTPKRPLTFPNGHEKLIQAQAQVMGSNPFSSEKSLNQSLLGQFLETQAQEITTPMENKNRTSLLTGNDEIRHQQQSGKFNEPFVFKIGETGVTQSKKRVIRTPKRYQSQGNSNPGERVKRKNVSDETWGMGDGGEKKYRGEDKVVSATQPSISAEPVMQARRTP